MRIAVLVGTTLLTAASLAGPALGAQGQPQTDAQRATAQARQQIFRSKHVPHEAGFRVFIVPDMEGMGSAVDIHEVIAGNEGERYKTLTSPDYWERFRLLLTKEVLGRRAVLRSL